MSVLAVIPARLGSTRLPGKPLADLAGLPMVVRVLRVAAAARTVDSALVATDSDAVVAAVRRFGGRAVLTRSDHPSGTSRVAEVAASHPHDLVLNLQGDEPLLDPAALDALVVGLRASDCDLATLVRPRRGGPGLGDPNRVETRCDPAGRALDFARGPVGPEWLEHVGVYLFRREILLRWGDLPGSPRAQAARLEQLRALDAGLGILCVETRHESIPVDTPADLARVRALLEAAS